MTSSAWEKKVHSLDTACARSDDKNEREDRFVCNALLKMSPEELVAQSMGQAATPAEEPAPPTEEQVPPAGPAGGQPPVDLAGILSQLGG